LLSKSWAQNRFIIIMENSPSNPKIPAPPLKKNGKTNRVFRFSISDIVSLSVIEIILLFVIIILLELGVFFIFKNSKVAVPPSSNGCQDDLRNCQANLSDQVSVLDQCNSGLKQQSELNSYDRIRMSDATNILLALQNYNFDKSDLPQSLKDLAAGSYYSGNLADPESGTAYYYKKTDSQNYVLCFYLSTGVWGTNKSQCPAKETNLNGTTAATSQ